MKKYINWKNIKELFVYGVVGVCTTFINMGTYFIAARAFHINSTISNMIAWFIGVNFAFFADKIFVFKAMDFSVQTLLKEMSSFYGMRLISGLIDIGLFFVAVEIMHWNDIAVKLGVMVLVVILNFIFSKFFIFSKKNVPEQQA